MATDCLDHSIGHAEALHDVVSPARLVQQRQAPIVLFPELANVVERRAARVAHFAPARLDVGQLGHRFVKLQNKRLSQMGM